jgi:hypothetical protein
MDIGKIGNYISIGNLEPPGILFGNQVSLRDGIPILQETTVPWAGHGACVD